MAAVGRHVVLGVTGGIAAYKAAYLARRLVERGATVRVVMTEAADEFIGKATFAAITGSKPVSDLFQDNDVSPHTTLGQWAEVIIIAPCTASTLSKLAHGESSDALVATVLASTAPVAIAPAMHTEMWEQASVQENLAVLAERGVVIVDPESGRLAGGDIGHGRLAAPEVIVGAVERLLVGGDYAGRRVLVTAGGTREPIDAVRFVGNRSSGKQGHAIAAACARLGAAVTLVSGPTAQADPAGVAVVHIESAVEMLEACRAALPADVAVCAAAVADWRAAQTVTAKIKKDGKPPAALALAENPDILASLSEAGNRRPALVIGFAAETDSLIANGQAKLAAKGCDWIIANDVSAASGVAGGVMGGDNNRVHLVTTAGSDPWPEMSKAAVAARLVERIAEHFGDDRPRRRDEAEAHPS